MQAKQTRSFDIGGLRVFDLIAAAFAPRSRSPDRTVRSDARPEPLAKPLSAPRRPVLARLDHWLSRQHQRDVEAYLAKSRDLYELEARIRDLERNGHDRPFPYY
jgi:hypothetical protein